MNAIEIRELSYTYPDGRVALAGVDLVVGEGERLALIGPNGAGKSTLLLNINGLLTGEGQVRIGGVEVTAGAVREVRRRVGFVFQNPEDQLFCPSVFDDVAFGPRNAGWDEGRIEQAAGDALARVGLPGAGGRNPFHMSLGEKKLVSIATVMVMDPDVFVFDEPTANLDARGRRCVAGIIDAVDRAA